MAKMTVTLPFSSPLVGEVDRPEAGTEGALEPVVVEPLCKSCRWWLVSTQTHGQCRRYPPVPLLSAGQAVPLTSDTYWCGEFSASMAARGA